MLKQKDSRRTTKVRDEEARTKVKKLIWCTLFVTNCLVGQYMFVTNVVISSIATGAYISTLLGVLVTYVAWNEELDVDKE